MIEGRHHGAFAVVHANGEVVMSAGDVERPTYARSAIKPLQALPLVESGAADGFAFSKAELSLACASHNSEKFHVQAVEAVLGRIGLSHTDLECGGHPPINRAAADDMIRAGESITAAHNNCSGKHSGFLATARHLGEASAGYIQSEHPVQQRIRTTLEEMTDTNLDHAPTGADGCGIPVIGMSLKATAYGMARFADPANVGADRAIACRRIFEAVTAEPMGQRVIVKTGAEAYFCAGIPSMSLGIAIKIDDGSTRASEVVMATLLQELLETEKLKARTKVAVTNVAGRHVGDITATLP